MEFSKEEIEEMTLKREELFVESRRAWINGDTKKYEELREKLKAIAQHNKRID